MFGIFLFEIKILLFQFLEHLPYLFVLYIVNWWMQGYSRLGLFQKSCILAQFLNTSLCLNPGENDTEISLNFNEIMSEVSMIFTSLTEKP